MINLDTNSIITEDKIFNNFKNFQTRVLLWLYGEKYRIKNREKILKRNKKWYKKNKEKNKIINKNLRIKYKRDCLTYYSNNTLQCECCNEKTYEFLTIDHIFGNGTQHRKKIGGGSASSQYRWLIKNHFPKGYRILCFNCNCGRSINGGICPHKTKMEIVLQN